MISGALIADGGLDFWNYWTKADSGAVEMLVFFGSVLLVVVSIFIWATFWRKPRRRRHSYSHSRPAAGTPAVGLPRRRSHRFGLLRILRRHRRRHRHRHHRRRHPANPTLADIGGLPPERQQPPSAP